MAATTDAVRGAVGGCLRDAMSFARSPGLHSCDISRNSACCKHRLFCSPPVHRFTSRIAGFMAFCVLFAVPWGVETARSKELDFEKARYALAVEYCRRNVERPMSLSVDRQTLCFDGPVEYGLNFSRIRDLKERGLFVVRSPGGSMSTAIAISDLLETKRATVVIYDYCLSACANYFFMASDRTYVLERAVVAFHFFKTRLPGCARIGSTADNEDTRLIVELCEEARSADYSDLWQALKLDDKFYKKRVIDRQYGSPPQSSHIRRYLKGLFEDTGRFPDVLWMWNPRFYRSAVKTEICYEQYPESQSEVDELAARFQLGQVIFDP
jgi:hypothetical protein